ncbi:MAG: hypothetical protein HYV97_18925 [Bdellovibrio sp.]|nr:hypothetical protein [Bdellovibrio sp.]
MRSLLKLAVLCMQIVLTPTAIAIEMRLDQGGSMSNIPVHNQGNLGTCYAHAASQATDAYIHTFTKGNEDWHTSTTMLGTEYRDNFLTHILGRNGDIEGGYVCTSFRRSIKKHGACDESTIEGMLDRMYPTYSSPNRVAKLFRDLTSRFVQTRYAARSSGDTAYLQGALELIKTLAQAGALPAELPSTDEIAQDLHSRTNLQFARKFFGHLCNHTPRVRIDNVKCRNHHLWLRGKRGLEQLIKKVSTNLKLKKAQPVMISYCGQVLEKGRKYRGLGNTLLDPFKTASCGYHASVIIGLRVQNKIPQFLVRNSWGEGCDGYSRDWECDKGNLWLDAEVLAKNMTDYHLLQTKR